HFLSRVEVARLTGRSDRDDLDLKKVAVAASKHKGLAAAPHRADHLVWRAVARNIKVGAFVHGAGRRLPTHLNVGDNESALLGEKLADTADGHVADAQRQIRKDW